MAESEEVLKSLLMKVKEESEKVGSKLNIQRTKIMASGPITSWPIDGKQRKQWQTLFFFLDSKITADGDCRHEIKRCSLLGRKVMTNLDSILEKGMAPHSSTLAWKIPWTEEPGGLQSMGRQESDTTERFHFHFSLSCTGEGNGNPLQCSCLENPSPPKHGGLPSMGLHRVRHNWSDLAAVAAADGTGCHDLSFLNVEL